MRKSIEQFVTTLFLAVLGLVSIANATTADPYQGPDRRPTVTGPQHDFFRTGVNHRIQDVSVQPQATIVAQGDPYQGPDRRSAATGPQHAWTPLPAPATVAKKHVVKAPQKSFLESCMDHPVIIAALKDEYDRGVTDGKKSGDWGFLSSIPPWLIGFLLLVMLVATFLLGRSGRQHVVYEREVPAPAPRRDEQQP